MFDELFGDLSGEFILASDSDLDNDNSEITDNTTSVIEKPIDDFSVSETAHSENVIDDLFGDLSGDFILQEDIEENHASDEIIDYSDPIDPIEAGIEISGEAIPLHDEDEQGFTVKDFTEDERVIYDQIKGFKAQCKEECTNDMEKAELARIQNVDDPLFFTLSDTYLFKTPWNLSDSKLKNDYFAARRPTHKSTCKFAAPMAFDTEYQTYLEEFKQYFTGRKKLNLTVQIGGIHRDTPKNIYCHWDISAVELPTYFPPLRKQDSCVFERYMRDCGYDVKFELKDSGIGEVEYLNVARHNVLQIPVFGHMLQADFMAMWQPKTKMFRYFERIISGRDQKNNLDGKKRLVGESDKPELLRPRIIVVDQSTGEKYALEMVFHDSQSMHGIGKSLAELAQVTNTPILDDKNIYTKEQKSRMLEMYLACDVEENRNNWRKYSVESDLKVPDIFINNAKQFFNLYNDEEINAGKYFTLPKPTIGRSVADIITARIITQFEDYVMQDMQSLAIKLMVENTNHMVTEFDSKQKFIAHLKKVFVIENDYDEVLFKGICKQISIKDEVVIYKEPKLLPKEIQQWIIATFCSSCSAMNLAGLSDTRRLNSKIQGGRCFRNRPLVTSDRGVIGDPDLDGAYSSMMRFLSMPIGAAPFLIEYDLKSKSQMLSLEQTRNYYKDELLPGFYQFIASHTDSNRDLTQPIPKILENPQDLIASYHPHPSIKQTTVGSEWLEKTAGSYVYTNQITNGIFTHWQFQLIDHVFSRELRKEMMNSKVVSGVIYRKSDRLESIRELLDGYRNYQGKNTYKIRGNSEIINRDKYRGWIDFNLGDLIVTPVRKLRSRYKKKTAENEFYKLIGNTVYGVLCSKYFPVSNVMTANNITSGVRTAVYCLEKGLNSHGSITDGGLANLLKVAFAAKSRKLNDKNSIQTHRLDKRSLRQSVEYGIIGRYDAIEWSNVEASFCDISDREKTIEKGGECKGRTEELLRFEKDGYSQSIPNDDARKLIDTLIFEHLAEQFPNLDLFHLDFTDDNGNQRNGIVRIESKGLVKECVLTGASNYLVRGGFHAMYPFNKNSELEEQGKVFCAMRSYRKGYGSHAQLFMEQLGEHPDTVDRSEVFDQSIILKVGLYQERYRSYFENSDYHVGDTFYMERLIREFPFSAYTCKSQEQRETWVREISLMRAKTGQSIESFFINDKGQIEYEKMIQAFDMWIEAGYTCLADVFGTNKTAERNMKMKNTHPEYEKLLKRRLDKRQSKR